MAFTEHRWKVIGEVGSGESGALIVEDAAGLRAAAKPAVSADGRIFRAAHEKIAADLAYELRLPVPPVVLWKDGPSGSSKRGLYSLSLWGGFVQFEYWNVARDRGLINAALCTSVAPAVAAISVFHQWLCTMDRKTEHFIIDLDRPPEDMSVAVVDHEFSMSAFWTRSDAPEWPEPFQLPDVPPNELGEAEAAERIAYCADATVSDICQRVPAEFLPDTSKDIIVSNLVSRKLEIHHRFSKARGATA